MFLLHPPVAPWLIRRGDGCRITLFCERSEGVQVYLRAEPDNEELLIEMHGTGRVGALERFEADLPWDSSNVTNHYAFKVLHDGRQTWLAADGVHPHTPPRDVHFKVCPDHEPPAWVKDQVFYQIFPDRFCQGDATLAVQTDEYTYGAGSWRVVKKQWGEAVDKTLPATAFYGGDLIGIRQQLDYLQNELGITAVYTTPIFTSGSNHRYDTEDYYNVDPHLGGNQALADLSAALHERGMRLVLDAVLNHTGYNHPWFNRFGRHDVVGAYQSAESPWRNWYTFQADGHYCSWKMHQSLPVLNMANPEVRAVLYDNPNAILRHWLRPPYAIDGWRFDVIHMLGEGKGAQNNAYYVREFRRAMREENAQAYVMGEHFSDATRWLQGDQEDGAMNYFGFAHPVRAWLAGQDIAYHPVKLSTHEFERWLTLARARIPYANQLAQLNLIDSHDTARFLTLLNGDLDRMRVAVTLLMTYAGVPCVYYGDEIGTEGGNDPDCRRCFDWNRDHWNRPLFEHYRSMIDLRKRRDELAHGAYQTLAVQDETLVFARYTEHGVSIVAVNVGDSEAVVTVPLQQLPVDVAQWRDHRGERARPSYLTVAPRSAYLCFGDA